MTTLTTARTGRDIAGAVRVPGLVCLAAGLLGAASGILLAVAPAAVDSERYSYPLSAAGFVVIQCWFVAQHLGLIAGLVGLGRSGAAGSHRLGILVAIAGMALLTVTELAAVSAAHSSYPGPHAGLLDASYGISSITIGVGLLVAGAAVARARIWQGWWRWLPLAMGVYVFVPMFPAMFGGFLTARLAITGWMLLFALLGWIVAQERTA